MFLQLVPAFKLVMNRVPKKGDVAFRIVSGPAPSSTVSDGNTIVSDI